MTDLDDPRLSPNPLPDKPLWITQTDMDQALLEIREACPVNRDTRQPENTIYRSGWMDAVQKFHYLLLNEKASYPY